MQPLNYIVDEAYFENEEALREACRVIKEQILQWADFEELGIEVRFPEFPRDWELSLGDQFFSFAGFSKHDEEKFFNLNGIINGQPWTFISTVSNPWPDGLALHWVYCAIKPTIETMADAKLLFDIWLSCESYDELRKAAMQLEEKWRMIDRKRGVRRRPGPMRNRVRRLLLQELEHRTAMDFSEIQVDRRIQRRLYDPIVYPVSSEHRAGFAVVLQFSTRHSGFRILVTFSPDASYGNLQPFCKHQEKWSCPEEFVLYPNSLTQPPTPHTVFEAWWNLSDQWMREPDEVQISRIPTVVEKAITYIRDFAIPYLRAAEAAYLKRLDAENAASGGSESSD